MSIMFNQICINEEMQPKSVHQWSGRLGFNPRLGHTKDLKNGTWYLFA